MEIKKKTKELSDQLLEVFDETKKCIKHAETHEDSLVFVPCRMHLYHIMALLRIITNILKILTKYSINK